MGLKSLSSVMFVNYIVSFPSLLSTVDITEERGGTTLPFPLDRPPRLFRREPRQTRSVTTLQVLSPKTVLRKKTHKFVSI